MKSAIPTLICGLALTHTLTAQSIVNSTNNPNLFGPAGSVNVPTPPAGILAVNLFNGSSGNQTLGTYWNANATGGVNLGALFLNLGSSAAQVALTGNSLQFNTVNAGLLGSLGVGPSFAESWSATGTFSNLTMAAGQTYRLSFDVDGSNGLLNSTLAIAPNFSVQLFDGGGTALASTSSGTLINLIGLLGTGVTSGTVTLDFVAPVGVNTNPGSVRFNGDAAINATALNLGTNFATISNLNISAVPEPSALLLGAVGALGLLRRRRI